MAKEQDNKKLYGGILDEDVERLSESRIAKMQESCRPTPEHFQELVRNAIEAQTEGQRAEGQRMEDQRAESQRAEGQRTEAGRRKRKGTVKVWFLAAAVFTACSIAVASGSSWLKEHLLERGFTESEAEVLLETEPLQQASERTDVVLPQDAEIEAVKWQDALLNVSEAYFDGEVLCFIAEPSEEAKGYELWLKDHASVNGYDGMTSLQRIEGEEKYFGRIELMEKQAAAEILQAETVEIKMRVVASGKPEEYEARTLYTWKDAGAYEEIFGTGAFESQYGPCYVVSRKEENIIYTPQELTLEIPLTEDAKQLIEQYRLEGRLGTEDGIIALAETEKQAKEGAVPEKANPMGQEASSEEPGEASQETPGASLKEASGDFEVVLDEAEGHVFCELPAASGSLKVDAQVVQRTEQAYTGSLQAEAVPEEALKSLYDEGEDGQWKEQESEPGWKGWQYQEQHIFVDGDVEHTHYQNDEVTGPEQPADETAVAEQVWQAQCGQVLDKLGMTGLVSENKFLTDLPQKYYDVQLLLEDLPVARYSQWNTVCGINMLNGELTGVNAPGLLKVVEKEEAELPDMNEILKHVAEYTAAGEIEIPSDGQAITEISLEYYIDLTKQGLIFRPVWNFKIPYLIEPGDNDDSNPKSYFYIDALTGALVRDAWGW
ncbi:MAG: hypothetical protein Q4C61_16445 [Lachnospiraceae bacterium]|nr:hypothetical protein [Lachnospiraceae bacterium]